MAQFVDPNVMMFTAFEPIQRNRAIFQIEGIPVFMVKKFSIPKEVSTEVEMQHLNVSWYVKGKTKWEPITITLFSPIAPSGAQIAMEFMRLSHESITGRDSYSDSYKKDCSISILGPVGDIIQNWTLKGAWVKSVDFGEFAWETENTAAEIVMDVQVDFAVLDF